VGDARQHDTSDDESSSRLVAVIVVFDEALVDAGVVSEHAAHGESPPVGAERQPGVVAVVDRRCVLVPGERGARRPGDDA